MLAAATNASQRGGQVQIDTSAVFNPNAIDPATGNSDPYNATFGYENFFTSGVIRLGANALINVSGGTAGSDLGGTVNFRAPLLADGATNANGDTINGDVNVFLPTAFNTNRGILGSGLNDARSLCRVEHHRYHHRRATLRRHRRSSRMV